MKIKGGRAPKKENQGGSGCFGEQARTPLIFFNTTPTPLAFHFCVFFFQIISANLARAHSPGRAPGTNPRDRSKNIHRALGLGSVPLIY